MRAVTILIEATADLQAFCQELRRITGAAEPHPPHISLLYAVDDAGRQPRWSSDESKLKRIAEECEQRVETREFLLDRPVIVVPEGSWENIRSWQVVRRL